MTPLALGAALISMAVPACAQSTLIDPYSVQKSKVSPDFEISYTSSLGREFPIYVFRADGPAPRPALVMYHGGSWKRGTPDQFYRQAKVWNQLGITVFLPVYALGETHGATPQQSTMDAFLSWQAVRQNAELLGIDANASAAGGGSAGGHLAAALATLQPPSTLVDHQAPMALVLFNPVIDNSPAGFGAKSLGPQWQSYSPLHHISAEHPPTLFMLGDSDTLIPVETGERYCQDVRAWARCELIIYPGGTHSWFNKDGFADTLRDSTRFLAETFSLEPVQFKTANAQPDATDTLQD